jgi:hypothetical protein
MRKTIIIATLAAFGGFCLANMSAFAALRYNIWQSSGERFQLGYVIGYLDAVALAGQRDPRAQIPTGVGKNFDKWVRDVNAFYADPANQDRSVPDAMYQIGSKIRDKAGAGMGTPDGKADPEFERRALSD